MSLPSDTRGKAAGSGYFAAQQGQNKILILGEAIAGYQYWDNQNSVTRSREVFEETPGIKQRKNNKTGKMEDERQQYFWAVPIWNFASEKIEVYQITQKGVRDQLSSYQANDAWGDPTGSYSLTIDKSGEGLETKYNVVANPDKNDPIFAGILAQYNQAPMNLDEQFFGKAEEAAPEAEATPAVEEAAAVEATPEVPVEAEVATEPAPEAPAAAVTPEAAPVEPEVAPETPAV